MIYDVHTLRDTNHSGSLVLIEHCQSTLTQQVTAMGGEVFGVFATLFGLASNEIYLVLMSPDGMPPLSLAEGIILVESNRFTPTIRPLIAAPMKVPGVYVFRWFEVNRKNIPEIVSLSNEAWTSFEGGFDTEIQGLFVAVDNDVATERKNEATRMLLITWYKDLRVWQASRSPAPEAMENFRKRHALTLSARPIATRLITEHAPALFASDT